MPPAIPISIVIPVYNGGSRIKKTLKKISQCSSFDRSEVIIVDDGSTDNTPEILGEISREMPISVIRKKNGGPGSARNIGAMKSQGEYIMFLGDDTAPADSDFIERHLSVHFSLRNQRKAVLGKIVWPNDRNHPLTLTEILIQGDGQQQFGFKFMEPGKEYGWPFFYTSNISFHRSLVEDWDSQGFSTSFYLAAFEDGEFAYRLSKQYSDFGIVYCPSAAVEHDHPYTFSGFIARQINCGQMMERLILLHPELEEMLLPASLRDALAKPSLGYENSIDKLVAIIEGIRAFCDLYDELNVLGTENWHIDFINSTLSLFTYYGYALSCLSHGSQGSVLGYLVKEWTSRLNDTAHRELFGYHANLFPNLP